MDSSSQLFNEEVGVAERSPDGRYVRYDETLGFGSFKVVYRGFDEIDGIEIAWSKIIVGDDIALRDKALSEATLAKSLKHKNVLRCYCYWFDRTDESVNMITELLTPGSLRKFRQKHGQVELKAIKNWARQILRGLCYLHAHDPPIIHRDLKCDNLFVSANCGEVKIGDFGFATSLQDESARTVSGTPEFMAPEMLEGEYDELVDVYAFGMCVLELVTCKYPYSECTTLGQIYKKVLTGVKPAALGEIKDLEVREFIEKCLVPASQRSSALELLNDPFLSCGKSGQQIVSQPSNIVPKVENVTRPKPQISIEGVGHLSIERVYPSTLQHCIFGHSKEYKLKGKRISENCISFTLWITALRRDTFSFVFDLESDTALSVAREMAELELDQAKFEIGDVVPVTELMDSMILEFVPTWKPSKLNRVEFSRDKVATTLGESTEGNKTHASFVHSLSTADAIGDFDSSMSSALPTAATSGDKDDGELKLELEAIDSHFSHCCRQLLKEEEEGTMGAAAKERWTSYRPRMGFV